MERWIAHIYDLFVQGYPVQTIANIMDIQPNTVEALLSLYEDMYKWQ